MVLGLSVAGVGEVVGAFLGGVGSEQFATYLVIEPGPSWWGWFLPKGLGISAGIYVMLRALDNIEKGWPQSRW
jgi:hypothetical protein